ncbi:MAG TPA: membrane dipeptidase [Longimicrobiales bacterium]|nr:membrane dipeptidase [Longimicrobiales bacterium]
MVIIDLHTHYPMHLLAREPMPPSRFRNRKTALLDWVRGPVLRIANRLWNYPGAGSAPAVTNDSLARSSVRAAVSVLYAPFDEVDVGLPYGAPPASRYMDGLLRQLDLVEASVTGQTESVIARNPAELDAAVQGGRVALVHAVEGGFHLGASPREVAANVASLARRGVAYITLAHLFWRQVATNTPALPFLPDRVYRWIFPQPDVGLTELGRAAVAAMVRNGVLVDVTHMSRRAFDETIAILDALDPHERVPVIASHAACDFGGLAYNLADDQVVAVARRGGVVGLIASRHYMARGLGPARSFADSVNILCRHIDHVYALTGEHDTVAIGSDLDGFIKPTLPGLETPAGYDAVEAALTERYGAAVARRICQDNAWRVLGSWSGSA